MGLYYADLGGTTQGVSTISNYMDTFGWTNGWRVSDSASATIWNASDGYGEWLFSVTPNVFIIRTATMEIYAAEIGSSPTQLNVLSIVQEIDALD